MASVLVPNTTRDSIVAGELSIIIVPLSNNSKFKEGLPLYLRASNGSNAQEKIINTIAERGNETEEMNKDDNGDYFAVIEKCSKFQLTIYNKKDAKYDIFINDLYLTRKEQKAFLLEQNMEEEEFLQRYGKTKNFLGHLIKFRI